jgi:hypothetical protein
MTPRRIGVAVDWQDISASAGQHTCGIRGGDALCWAPTSAAGSATAPVAP